MGTARCFGYRDSREYDSIVCWRCSKVNPYTYEKCLRKTQDRKDKENKMHENSTVSLVLFDKSNNVLKDVKLTNKQLKKIYEII